MNLKAAIFFAAILYSAIYSQNSSGNKDSIYTLEPVVVSARLENSILNVPYAIDLIDSADIAGTKGLSLSEFLNITPGLFIGDRNNPSLGDKITLRGIGSRASFGVRGIKIIYDGIPLTFADGQSELNNIDFSSIGKIEILHGPASSLYGNAAGGVINILSEKPSQKFIYLNPSFTFGSYGFKKYNIKASGTIKEFSYILSLNKLLYDGFREHSSANSFSVSSNLSYRISESFKLKTIINYYDSPYLLNPSSLSKNDALTSPAFVRPFVISQGAGEKVSSGYYGITLNSTFDDNFRNTTTIYYVNRSLLNPIPGTIISLDRNAGGFRTFFEKKTNGIFSQAVLTFNGGLDFEFQSDLRKEYENNGLNNNSIGVDEIFDRLEYGNSLLNQKENVTGIAPFISARLIINKHTELHTALRYDNYIFKAGDRFLNDGDNSGERKMGSFSPMFGLIYLPSPYLKIYANYSTSFQTPTTNELSNNPSGIGGFNSSLNPERLKSYEIGAWGIVDKYKINFEAAFYILKFNNMIISYQSQASGSEEIFYKNAGEAENIGLEIKAGWKPLNEIAVTAAYSKMDFTFKDYTEGYNNSEGSYSYEQLKGNNVPGVPKDHIAAEIKFNTPFSLFFNLKADWFGSYFANDLNGPVPGFSDAIENYINEAYFKIDITSGYNLKFDKYKIVLSIGIYNALDKRYNASIVPNAAAQRYFEPSAGRNFFIKTGIEF